VVHKTQPEFTIGKGIVIREGTEICLLSAGTVLTVALGAADLLEKQGRSTRVVSFHTIKPLDTALLADTFKHFRVVGNHRGTQRPRWPRRSVAEWLTDQPNHSARLVKFGTRDEFLHLTCEQKKPAKHFGLTPEAIAAGIQRQLA